jgi:branched-chain amino acid transport system substrate-binding protein
MPTTPRFFLSILLLAVCCLAGCSTDVKIGAVISETGAVAPYGNQVTRGIDLALEEVNAAGGFKGAPIQLVYRDDGTNAEQGRQAVEELISTEQVEIIIGAVSSTVTLEIAPICEKKKVLLLSPTSSAPRISEAGEYIYRNYPSDILEGTAMADFARKIGVRQVVILALDNEFGVGLSEVFSIAEGDASSIPAMIEEITQLNPQAVYLVSYVDLMGDILRQLREAGSDALAMGSGSVIDQLSADAGDAAQQFVYAQPTFDPDSEEPAVKAFVEAFRAKYRRDPDIFAAHGYDAMKILHQAMLDTGFAFPDEIRRGLNNLSDYVGAAGRTQFDERGDVVRYPTVFVIENGEPVTFEQFEENGGMLNIPQVTR